MKQTKQAFRLITNKYLIAVALFTAMMFFFDDNNLFVQLDRKHQLNELLANKKYYEDKIKTTGQQLSELQSTPASIEKFARENYLMKRDNEDVFVVQAPAEKEEDKK